MPYCDMCGRESYLFKTLIEGTELNVCKNCSRHGKVIQRLKTDLKVKKEIKREQKRESFLEPKKELVQEIVDDYSNKIKNAREKLDLKQEDFAKKINEKLSLIHHIETNKFKPNLNLARKLERFLNIILVEQREITNETPTTKTKGDALTIGDIIKIKRKD